MQGRPLLATLCCCVVLVAAVAGGTTAVSPVAADPARTLQEDCSFPVTETDATGTAVTVTSEPGRVVTLAPSAAQTLWELGAQSKVVGVSKYATYLDGAGGKLNVSGGGQSYASVEKVVAAEPDLVLAPNVVPNETVAKLRESGVTVYKFDRAVSVAFVVEKTRLTGRLVGECGAAERVTDRMEADLETVAAAVEGADRPRVLYYFFGFTAGEGTFVHEIITLAGGTNVAAEAGITGYREVSAETVVAADPEWIVRTSDDTAPLPRTEAWNGTTAVREGNVVVVDANDVSQPAPRILRPIRKLARTFHPEAYAAANATTGTPMPVDATSPDETPTPTPTRSPVTTTSPEPTGTSTPGFGVVAALLALCGVLVLVRRRAR